MTSRRFVLALALVTVTSAATAQTPGAPQPPRAGGRRTIAVMTLTSAAFTDGGKIPAQHAQLASEASPPLNWTGVPDSVVSFVLLVHDADAATGNGTDNVLHWLVWGIPGAARALPPGIPHRSQLDDGMRQISVSGPYYRGPAAPSTGPAHHYVFELFALDTTLDIPAVGASPAATRAAIITAMAGHVRGKGVLVGRYKRPPT